MPSGETRCLQNQRENAFLKPVWGKGRSCGVNAPESALRPVGHLFLKPFAGGLLPFFLHAPMFAHLFLVKYQFLCLVPSRVSTLSY